MGGGALQVALVGSGIGVDELEVMVNTGIDISF